MIHRTPLLLALAAMVSGLTIGCTSLNTGTLRATSPELSADSASLSSADTSSRGHSLAGRSLVPRPIDPPSLPRWAENPPLSPGDRLQVEVQDGEGFSGRYEVGIDGALQLPYLPALPVAGSDTRAAEVQISAALVTAEFFKPDRLRVSVRVHEWSHAQVHVSGAVFDPGMVSINARNPEERALKRDLASGDFPSQRMLTAALRAAGGVRPDAAVDAIQVIRSGRTLVVDYSGLIQGHAVAAVPLMSGDRVVVSSSGKFDAALVAPSAITPPGIRIFMSNLTTPATGNAASAIGKVASSLPYGSRLLTAAVSANCVGGTQSTSAGRLVVLVRSAADRDAERVIERPIDDLLREPQRDDLNPFVMPNDSVACYDSGVTNLRDIARALGEILLPLSLLSLL